MSWPGAHREHVQPSILPNEVMLQYLALRKARLIGMLWTEGDGQYYLAPLDSAHGYNCREHIRKEALTAMILSLDLARLRKSVQSETAPVRAICAA